MEKCKAKAWFTLKGSDNGKPGIHGRDNSAFILFPEMDIWWYRRQDGRVELMMEFEHTAPKPSYFYKSFIGHVSFEEFEENFTTCNIEDKIIEYLNKRIDYHTSGEEMKSMNESMSDSRIVTELKLMKKTLFDL
jgi:hypothetical protein